MHLHRRSREHEEDRRDQRHEVPKDPNLHFVSSFSVAHCFVLAFFRASCICSRFNFVPEREIMILDSSYPLAEVLILLERSGPFPFRFLHQTPRQWVLRSRAVFATGVPDDPAVALGGVGRRVSRM